MTGRLINSTPLQLICCIGEQLAEPGRQANLQDIRNVLEDGQALAAMGITDADQETVEIAHANVTRWQGENYTRLLVPRYTPPMLLSGKDTSR